MKIFFSFIFILFFTLTLSASSAKLTPKEKDWIKNHPVITLGTESTWAPFVITNSETISGYDVDILNLINQNTGANFQLTLGNWNDMVDKAIKKEIDGLSTSSIHKERAQFFNFSNSYATTKKYLITSNHHLKNANSNEDFIGIKIGYLEKNLFDKKLASSYTASVLVPFKSINELLQSLLIGNIDATIGSYEVFELAEKQRISYLRIISEIPNSTLNLVFSVRKDYPEAISIINKGLDAISNETKISLNKRWFGIPQNSVQEELNLNLTNEEKAYLNNKKVLTIANLSTLPPFNYNENNTPMGYSIDYMKLMGKYLNTNIQFISKKSWDEFITMLKNQQIDIIPHVAITNERKKYFEFTDFNHVEYVIGIAVNKNSTIKSMHDLKDKTIAVTKKSFIESYFKHNFPQQKLYLASSTSESVEAVSSGKADVSIGSLPTLNYYIQKNWLSNIKTIQLPDVGLEPKVLLPMAVSKDNLLLKSILEKVNQVISHNEVANLKNKWMNISTNSHSFNNEELKYLREKKIITMCVLPDWLPFEQIDDKGKHKGIGADFMRIISKNINTPIELRPTKEWSQSLQNIRDRKCDILPVAMDIPSRRDAMNFTKPYVAEPFVIATKTDKLFIKDASSLSHKKIGIVKSYAFIEVLKEKNPLIEIVDVKNTQEGLERVSKGELFGYIDTMPTIGYEIQKYSFFDLKIAGKLEFYITISVASRNDEPLLNSIMQKALDEISEEQKRTIVNKWVEIKVAQDFDYTRLWQISALFLLIVAIIIYKNRTVVILNKNLIQAKLELEDQHNMVNKYVLIITTDTNGIITDVNQAYCKATLYSKDELIGKKHTIMKHPDTDMSIFKELWETISQNKIWSGEIKNFRKDKTLIWFNIYIEPIIKNNIKIGYRAISEDITDKKRIEELSITDKLTGLFNRMKLDEIMSIKVTEFKRYQTPFSIILIDIDDFKQVNDSFGHDVGDYVLKAIAEILKTNLRTTDAIGRWGGEEFLVICSNTHIKETLIVAENLRKTVEETLLEKVNHKTISLGVSEFTKHDSINTIFKRVDDALYQAKHSGKNKAISL